MSQRSRLVNGLIATTSALVLYGVTVLVSPPAGGSLRPVSDTEAATITGGQTGCAPFHFVQSFVCGSTPCGGCPIASQFAPTGGVSLKNVVQGPVGCSNCGKNCGGAPQCTGGDQCMVPRRATPDLGDIMIAGLNHHHR